MSTTTQTSNVARPRADVAERPGARRSLRSGGGLFTIPYVVAFLAFMVVPVVWGLVLAFTDESLTAADTNVVGFANFGEALTDPQVWQTLGNTVWFTVLTTVPLVLLPLALALLVNAVLPGQWLWRLAFFGPFLLPVTVVALVWQFLFQPDLGLYNQVLGFVGIDPVGWLTDETVAMWSVALTTVWWTLGFNFLLYLAAAQNIPALLYEAASIDGAGTWRRLFSITLPMLNRTTSLIVVLQILASLKVFDQIYILWTGSGGPNGAARPILEYVYDTGFTNFRLGYAAAISYIFFAIIIVLSLLQARLFTSREDAS